MKFWILILASICSGSILGQQNSIGIKGATPLNEANTAVAPKNTRAVVIGISDYQEKDIPDLRFADKDALAFANYLRSPAGGSLDNDHLQVLTNQNATAGRVAEALDALVERTQAGDQVIIYFSGHGDVERKTISQPGFLLCWDSPARVYMGGGTYSLAFLQEIVSTLSVQNKAKVLVVTDACHAGKLAGSQIGGSQATAANLAKQFANEVKILSCQPNEFSLEGEQWGGGRGIFSYHLVDGLFGLADRNGDGSVSVGEIDRYLEDKVTAEAAPQSQVPMLLGNKTERLATVNAAILAALQKSKAGGMPVFAATEGRGFEEEVLAKADSSVRQMYLAFKKAVREKRFLSPENDCAELFYAQLAENEALAPLRGMMRRNYAAALQDDAQQVLNEWMKTSDDRLQEAAAGGQKGRLPQKLFTEKVRSFPRLLGRAAELLGKGHYMYATLQARKYFFEGYLLANADRNPNRELGEQVLAAFRTALGWQAELPQAWWQMSRVHGYNLLQPDSAEVYAQKAMELNPSWVLPCTDLAFMFSIKYKQFDRAKPWLEQAMQVDSNSTAVRTGWGVYFDNKKEYLKAEQQFKKAIQLDSTYAGVYGNLGMVYENTRRYDEAEQQYQKVIRLDSTIAITYNNLGDVYYNTGRYAEAGQQFKKAIQLDSTYAGAYYNLGNFYLITGRYDEAEQQYKKAIRLDSTYAAPYSNLGTVYLNTGRYAEAEQQLKKAIQLDSTYAFPYNNLGIVYYNTRSNNEAEQQFKKAIQLDSTYALSYINLGNVYGYTGRYAEAEQQYKKVIQLDSTYATAYTYLAVIQSLQNQTDAAFGYLEKALKNGFNLYNEMQQDSSLAPLREQKERWEALMQNAIVPDTTDAKAWNNLGQVYIRARNYAPAERAMRKALALDATSAPFRSNLGFVYLNLGRYPEAEVALTKAIALDSTFANARKHLGLVCFKTNRPKEAQHNFLKAIVLNPNYAGAMLGMAYALHSEGKTAEAPEKSGQAIGYVEQAISKGATLEQLEKDEDLAPLRALPEWKDLMKKHFPDKIKE